jgi:hypothetical protein
MVSFTSQLCYPIEVVHGTHWIGRVGPMSSLDAVVEGKSLSLPETKKGCRLRDVQILRPIFCVRSRGSVMVKALCYKPEGRGFETR